MEAVAVTPKKGSKPWEETEETALIVEVLEREHTLFGDIKGPGTKSVHRKRTDAWQEITDLLNSRFVTTKRDVEEIKKKFFNSKQRLKEKIDRLRRAMRQTGGGPAPPELNETEQVFYDRMCERPAMTGLASGVDTDAGPSSSSTSLEISASPSPSPSQVVERDTVSNSSKTSTGKRSQQALTLENTVKDTKRIEKEMEKLDKEMAVLDAKKAKLELQQEKLKSERDCIEIQKIYYTLKIQAEYGITINVSNE